MDKYWNLNGGHGLIVRTAFRTGQFVFAIVAAGLYGADLAYFSRTNTKADGTWIFAEVLVVFSVVLCAAHCIFTIKHLMWSLLDSFLALMWMVVAILAGQAAFGDGLVSGVSAKNTHAMALLWIDLINMVLWLATLVEASLLCCTARTVRRKLENLEMDTSEESRSA
ncbi:hypothetical protein PFICI_03149 [Pestalotiopsis fici W106-1]|uniref:MARVEL domain-containing protein n=1 Tax=Pestalotiopsis fici (strain W106-1 / CGMCC3.15140) TaxID=1229662 RepID=W3XGI6_PESFW|nr:uncharacterized protein PFICI_03149 [Pestalotiopsis fici W106-1]ETS85124.1 hypothetical protein PFICI_03149 [Pestalotiopsis fici W106-1]